MPSLVACRCLFFFIVAGVFKGDTLAPYLFIIRQDYVLGMISLYLVKYIKISIISQHMCVHVMCVNVYDVCKQCVCVCHVYVYVHVSWVCDGCVRCVRVMSLSRVCVYVWCMWVYAGMMCICNIYDVCVVYVCMYVCCVCASCVVGMWVYACVYACACMWCVCVCVCNVCMCVFDVFD